MSVDNEDTEHSVGLGRSYSATPLSPAQLSPASLYQQLAARIPDVWPALQLIAATADEKDWALYVVGGAVRDLLLSLRGEPYPLIDIDLVVEGAETGSGVTLAESVQAIYPQTKLQVYGNFQTATLTWPVTIDNSSASNPSKESTTLLIDIATARTESYPHAAANPEVQSSTLRQDLHRRDFTINAMAIRLNGETPGQLIDTLGGIDDLQQRLVRALHADSFIDDPTRIFRAIRFATRLDFRLESQTERYITQATGSELYARLQADVQKGDRKVPALQGRLKAELQYLLSSAQWKRSLAAVDKLGALVCLQPELVVSPKTWQQLDQMDHWLNKFDVQPPKWLMRLELLLAQLEPVLSASAAKRLTLDDKSQHRLKNLHQWEADAVAQLGTQASPSRIYQLFHVHQHAEMLLMAARHPYTLAPFIWQYISQLSRVSPLINGGTLKRLGYSPGPHFREILSAVYELQLDNKLGTAEEASAYVLSHYHPSV